MSKINLFNSIKVNRPGRNFFDLTHDVKLSFNMGQLVPTMCMECVPGDKVMLSNNAMLRLAPMVAPMMHRVDVYSHYFFVPTRLLWENWKDFIANKDPLPAAPYVTVNTTTYNNLMDYFGIPGTDDFNTAVNISALPFAAYQAIFNEYYRDQNLMAEVDYVLANGNNTAKSGLLTLRTRCWEHDYFTAALPFAQRGEPVTIPIGTLEDVLVKRSDADGTSLVWTANGGAETVLAPSAESENPDIPQDALYADTSSLDLGQTTINDLRRAYKLQEWLELSMRGGRRLKEIIWNYFGVKSPDARLQRPEYITGTKSPVAISEVLNTTGTENAPQGAMAGHGISTTEGRYGSYYCQEHGFIICIMSVMPKTAYFQGIDKMWLKINDPFEYFWPQFAHIGEQEVTNNEVFAYQANGTETFGYVPRYAEYKFMNNRVCGAFRNDLDFWHMARHFASQPHLNEAFVKADPTNRIWAVTEDTDHLWAHVLHRIGATRSMPKFGTPSF